MDFLANKSFLRDLLSQGDQMHTFNGGKVPLKVLRTSKDDGIELVVSAPTVSTDSFQVILSGSRLMIEVYKGEPDPEEVLKIPMHQFTETIPVGVSLADIQATRNDEEINVWMPYVADWKDEPQVIPIVKR